jgi:hypothetical protein
MGTRLLTVNDVLAGHVRLDVECLDRIYLNGYVPNLQVGGQVVQFLTKRGFPIPSPAVVAKIGDRFRDAVRVFAASNHIPIVKFGKNDRKITVMTPYVNRRPGLAGPGLRRSGWRGSTSGSSPVASARPGPVGLRTSVGTGRTGV